MRVAGMLFVYSPMPVRDLGTKTQTTTGTKPIWLLAYTYFCLCLSMACKNIFFFRANE